MQLVRTSARKSATSTGLNNKKSDHRKYDLLRVTRFLKPSKDYLPKAIHAIDKYSGTWNGFLPDLYRMWPTTIDLINQLICILGNLDSAPWEDCVINATVFHAFGK